MYQGKMKPKLTIMKSCGAELLLEDPNRLILQEGKENGILSLFSEELILEIIA
jgi:hypothetical protein